MTIETEVNLLTDFGGTGSILHLAHANGFPPGSYRLLANSLTQRYQVIALPARPLWPGSVPESTPSWRPMAEDLAHGLQNLGLGGILGVGHSLGGVLTLWAAIDHPQLFRGVVLIEPVILPSTWLWGSRLLRTLGLRRRQPLVQGALRRRRTWPSRQACFTYLRSKPFFSNWSDGALWDYVDSGTRAAFGNQVELVYPPEWEAHIFATPPLRVWRDVPRLRHPCLIVRGEQSKVFQTSARARMARLLPQARLVTITDGGHLVPMERPEETAAAILAFANSLDP
jgi:pimeloyl-ACP methyl ester carboxylesterase